MRILIPDDYEVELLGDQLDRSESGGMVLYESGAISNPDEWLVIMSARNDKALARTRTELLDHIIEISAWPDDRRWARFVRTQLNEGLPELEALVDLPWTNAAKLRIIETVSPYLYGYAGWYSSSDNTIEIGDKLDAEVILHEISHIWFNDELFAERWVNEGYAQTYANLALERTGGRDRSPERIRPNARGAQPLNLWDNPSFRDEEEAEAQEDFGYNASWFVIDAVADEIGPDKMREVLAAARDGQITYLGDPSPEHTTETITWRQLLDLYQEIGGSEDAPDLFREHVVSARQRSDLRDRERARAAYAKLVDAGDGWTAPVEVREQMSGWRFERATEAMQTAKRILAVRDEIEETLDGTGVGFPASFEEDYEGEVEDLDALLGTARGYLASAKVIAEADEAAKAGKGLFGSIGLWGNDYEDLLDTAGTRFEDADAAGATRAATQVSRVLDDADGVGQGRALKAGGTVVGVGVIGWSFRRVRRRRRTRRAAREAEARADAETAASIATAEQASATSVPAWAWWYGTTEPTAGTGETGATGETAEGDDTPRALDTEETSEAPQPGSDATSGADPPGAPTPEATHPPYSPAGTDADTPGDDPGAGLIDRLREMPDVGTDTDFERVQELPRDVDL